MVEKEWKKSGKIMENMFFLLFSKTLFSIFAKKRSHEKNYLRFQ